MHQTQLLDTERAARLAGVTRHEIQNHIATGALPVQDDKIDVLDLAKLYPEVGRRRTTMVEVAAQIREDAFAKAMRRDESPNIDQLQAELRQARQEISFFRAELGRCKTLISDLERLLGDYQQQAGDKQRVEAMIRWLRQQAKFLQRLV